VLVVFRTLRRGWYEGAVILWWLVLPVTLLSLGTSKLYHYAYPYLPPLALAAGYGVSVLAGFAWSAMSPWISWIAPIGTGWDASRVPSHPERCLRNRTDGRRGGARDRGAWHCLAVRLGHVLFRNSNPLRAGLIGVAALIFSRRGRTERTELRAVLLTLLLAVSLPLAAYEGSLSALRQTIVPCMMCAIACCR